MSDDRSPVEKVMPPFGDDIYKLLAYRSMALPDFWFQVSVLKVLVERLGGEGPNYDEVLQHIEVISKKAERVMLQNIAYRDEYCRRADISVDLYAEVYAMLNGGESVMDLLPPHPKVPA